MKSLLKLTSLLLCIALTLTLFASCGKNTEEQTASDPINAEDLKIGVLFADNAVSTGDSYYHVKGLEAAASELGLDTEKQLIYKKNITDVTFSESESFVAETVTEEETSEAQTESVTTLDKDGNPAIVATPVKPQTPETAYEAVSSLLSDGCNIIIATDAIYDSFTQYIAKQCGDVIVIQYKGTGTDIENLYNYDANIYEAFYLAGAVAATVSESENIGFVAGVQNDETKKNINAFALGAISTDKDAKIILRPTNTKLDLGLERTLPEKLINEDSCTFIMQSVYTALPQTVAESSAVPTIGFGYDMSPDAKTANVCSVIIDHSVFFKMILTSIIEGKFESGSYVGTVENGSVYLSEFRRDAEKLNEVTASAKQTLADKDIFKGFNHSNGYANNITLK